MAVGEHGLWHEVVFHWIVADPPPTANTFPGVVAILKVGKSEQSSLSSLSGSLIGLSLMMDKNSPAVDASRCKIASTVSILSWKLNVKDVHGVTTALPATI